MKFLRNLLLFTLLLLVGYLWVGGGLSQWQLSEWLKVPLSFIFVLIPGGVIANGLYGSSFVRFFSYGFPISIALLGVLGLLARTFHLSIDTINFILFIFTVVCVLSLVWQQKYIFRLPTSFSVNKMTMFSLIVVVFILLIFSYLSILHFQRYSDILIYNAEVTFFASGKPLNWQEIYFDTNATISDRFFLSYWTLVQGLIVHLSGVHILQSQFIFGTIVIWGLGISIYSLGRDIGYSRQQSLVIVVLAFVCYAILMRDFFQPGRILLSRAIHDKVVAQFVFFPAVIGAIYHLVKSPSPRLYALVFLLLTGILFTHPIALGLVVLFICGWMMLSIITTRKLSPYFQLILLCAVVMTPLIIIRLTTASEQIYDFGDNPVSYGFTLWVNEDKTLYAPTVSSTGIITYVILALAGITSLIRIKQPLNRLILSIVITVGIGLFPYTSWFYGRVISTQHIWRNVWIVPYGLMLYSIFEAFVVLLRLVFSGFNRRLPQKRWINLGLIVMVFVVSSIVILSELSQERFTLNADKRIHKHDELIDIAYHIESTHDERVTVLGDDFITSMLPTISYQTGTFMFFSRRRMFAFSLLDKDEGKDRERRQKEFFATASSEEQLETLETYNVDYILYETNKYQEFIDSLLSTFPDLFELELETDKYQLLRYIPQFDN